VSTATVRFKTSDVPLSSIAVFHAGIEGMDIQLGPLLLGVDSPQYWEDFVERVRQCFAALPPRRCLPPRTDGMTANLAGSCYSGEPE
jgi:hypothetical protein